MHLAHYGALKSIVLLKVNTVPFWRLEADTGARLPVQATLSLCDLRQVTDDLRAAGPSAV